MLYSGVGAYPVYCGSHAVERGGDWSRLKKNLLQIGAGDSKSGLVAIIQSKAYI